MSSKTVPLKSIARIKGGKRLPKGLALQTKENSHPYLRIVDMGSKYVSKANLQYVPDNVFPSISRYITNTNDVLISIVGTIGLVALVDDELDSASLTENCVKITLTNENFIPEYLYYYLSSEAGQNEIKSRQVGSTQPKLPLYNIGQIPIPSLSKEDQIAIVKCLGDLDRKIELNRRINETLEQIGRVLFKRYYLKSSACGEWKAITLGSFANIVLGGTPSRNRSEYWGGDIGWINSGAVNQYRITRPSEYITREGFEKSATKLLPKGATVVAITGATLGQVSRLEESFAANQSVIGIYSDDRYMTNFLYFWIVLNIDEITRHSTGGAQQHINKSNVENTLIKMPPANLISQHGQEFESILNLICILEEERNHLTSLRDILLPQLMNGRVGNTIL